MKPIEITVEWLKQIDYKFFRQSYGVSINDVLVKDLTVNLDGRGEVTELWSKTWIADGFSNVQHI